LGDAIELSVAPGQDLTCKAGGMYKNKRQQKKVLIGFLGF